MRVTEHTGIECKPVEVGLAGLKEEMREIVCNCDVMTHFLEFLSLGLAEFSDHQGRTFALRSEVSGGTLPSVEAVAGRGAIEGLGGEEKGEKREELKHGSGNV